MPAALDVNWDAIKTLSIAVGMLQASNQTGVSYPAIRQRASRESWFAPVTTIPPTKLQTPVTPVTKASDALQTVLAEDETKVKTFLSKTLRRTSGHMSKMLPEHVYATADKAKAIVGSAAQLYQWDAKAGQQTNVAVNIALLGS